MESQTHRPRATRARMLTLFLVAVTSIPIDIWVADMTVAESMQTRVWIIAAKTLLGGPYGAGRAWIFVRTDPWLAPWMSAKRCRHALLDAPIYTVFQLSIYAAALAWHEKPGHTACWALSVLGATSFFVGPFVGMLMDGLEWLLGKRATPRPVSS